MSDAKKKFQAVFEFDAVDETDAVLIADSIRVGVYTQAAEWEVPEMILPYVFPAHPVTREAILARADEICANPYIPSGDSVEPRGSQPKRSRAPTRGYHKRGENAQEIGGRQYRLSPQGAIMALTELMRAHGEMNAFVRDVLPHVYAGSRGSTRALYLAMLVLSDAVPSEECQKHLLVDASYAELADLAGVDRQTVRNGIRQLKEAKLITEVVPSRGRGKPAVFVLGDYSDPRYLAGIANPHSQIRHRQGGRNHAR